MFVSLTALSDIPPLSSSSLLSEKITSDLDPTPRESKKTTPYKSDKKLAYFQTTTSLPY